MDVTKSCRDISQLTQNAQTACKLFIESCKAKGLNVLITETYRSQERQNYLYEQGRTRAGKQVTWTLKSRHTSKRAWDICQNIKGKEYSDVNFFKQCGQVAKELGITWGGTWKEQDTPHFEIAEDWKPPVKYADDKELYEACRKLLLAGINININVWKRKDLIKLSNVPSLLNKLGGVDVLVRKKVIANHYLWTNGKPTADNVRSLIIKYAATLG